MRSNTDTGLLPETLTKWPDLGSIYNAGIFPVLSYNVNSVALIHTGVQFATVVALNYLFQVMRADL